MLIAGPTASGKSCIAAEIAARFGGTVVNADSMQVYRDLRVITARPSAAEEARVPHRLYGVVDAAHPWSVGDWLVAAALAIAEAESAGRLPVLVGGTGLYFSALLEGLAEIPPIPPALRERLRQAFGAAPPQALHAELARRDPATAAAIRPSDPQRILRAIEVLEATGRPLSAWQSETPAPLLAPGDCLRLVIATEPEALAARIERRFAAMMAEGGLEEVAALLARGLPRDVPAMKALGVPHLAAHLAGELALETAAQRAVTATRQYAKRQRTWLRGRMADWTWTAPEDAVALATRKLGR